MLAARFAGFALLFFSLAACTIHTDSGPEPKIDSVEAPDTVALGGDGKYHVEPIVTFHDPAGEKVVAVSVALSNASGAHKTLDIDVAEADQSSDARLHLDVELPAGVRGEVDYEIVLRDAKGNASAPAQKHVTLQ